MADGPSDEIARVVLSGKPQPLQAFEQADTAYFQSLAGSDQKISREEYFGERKKEVDLLFADVNARLKQRFPSGAASGYPAERKEEFMKSALKSAEEGFNQLDADHNGFLSSAEFLAPRKAMLIESDANKDNLIEATEIKSYTAKKLEPIQPQLEALASSRAELKRETDRLNAAVESGAKSMQEAAKSIADLPRSLAEGEKNLQAEAVKKGFADPDRKLTLTAGCGLGFGGVELNQTPEREKECDQENLAEFLAVFGDCSAKQGPDKAGSRARPYDIDHDGCVDCKDFYLWKKNLKEWHEDHERSSNGSELSVPRCIQ